ncbi:Monocarboxylate transporter 13 [Hondaea fermentalgiana]|uniref:Monocarboxylate transporter 13 n=1 Tax=Hondaea fermentalgiana TaxID=2315210 RepID=A0A2R5GG08_9STRA|nr:Monocarboxylate transporter 13 [Hondaea fermentalgiana]|eukprot:GBG27181.1 Monocarboxylate transporter 13 [Hondaea fermentalgiana]
MADQGDDKTSAQPEERRLGREEPAATSFAARNKEEEAPTTGSAAQAERPQQSADEENDKASSGFRAVHSEVEVSAEDSQEETNAQPKTDELPPQEGVQAWINVLGSFLTQFVCLGNMYSVGVFFTRYQESFDKGLADISLIYQIQVACFMGGGFFAGRISDRLGIRPVFFTGIIFYGAGYLLGSFANEWWQIVITHGLLVGMGHGCMYWPAISVLPMWFEKRRALALGIAVFGGGIGNFVMGVVVEKLLTAGGFRFALRIILVYSCTLLLLAMFCLKRRLPPFKHTSFCFDFSLCRERNWLLFAGASMFFQCAYNLPFAHLAAYTENQGFDSEFAAFAVGAIGIGSAVGRISLGVVADKLGRVRTFQALIWGTAIGIAIWNACTTKGSILFFAIYFGFVSGGFIALMPAVTAYFYGVEQLGTVMGSFVLFLVPGSFIGPYVAGMLYDNTGSYTTAIWIFAAVEIMAAIIFSFLDLSDSHESRQARLAEQANDTRPSPESPQVSRKKKGDIEEQSSSEHVEVVQV